VRINNGAPSLFTKGYKLYAHRIIWKRLAGSRATWAVGNIDIGWTICTTNTSRLRGKNQHYFNDMRMDGLTYHQVGFSEIFVGIHRGYTSTTLLAISVLMSHLVSENDIRTTNVGSIKSLCPSSQRYVNVNVFIHRAESQYTQSTLCNMKACQDLYYC